MKLIIDEKILQSMWGSSTEFWFSRMDYRIYRDVDLPSDDSAKLFEAGFIPFANVSNEEVIRAYVESLSNKKIVSAFDGLEGDRYVDMFWKYHKAYKEVADGFEAFEEAYVKKELEEWCDENAIEYEIKAL